MKTFDEVNKYYRFPLHIPEWCPVYIETADNETAFNLTFPDEDNPDGTYYSKIVQKLNDPTSIDLKDSFYINEYRIVSKERDENILIVRGWGMLTGIGANHLDAKYAAEIQDSFLAICCDRLNTSV